MDRRAWHLAVAAAGVDESASAALEQAGIRGRDRSAYATAAAAFERAGRLTADTGRRARLLLEAAEAGWLAGLADRAVTLLDEARAATGDPARLVGIDQLAGHIAIRRGPVMRGHAILTAAAGRADPERAVTMLAEAAFACFYAGNPAEMLSVAERARARAARERLGTRPLPGGHGRRDGADPRRGRRRRRGSDARGDRARRELGRAA